MPAPTEIVTVDISLTWKAQVRVCVMLLLHSESPDAHQVAINELERMGDILDKIRGV